MGANRLDSECANNDAHKKGEKSRERRAITQRVLPLRFYLEIFSTQATVSQLDLGLSPGVEG